jgi:VanZ family protein
VSHFLRDRLPALVWWALSVIVLVLPGSATPVGPPWLIRFAAAGGDKLVHALLFFGLALLTVRALRPLDHRRALGWSVALGMTWAPLSEWIQHRVPNRDASLADVAADLVGLALAAMLVWWRGDTQGALLSERR